MSALNTAYEVIAKQCYELEMYRAQPSLKFEEVRQRILAVTIPFDCRVREANQRCLVGTLNRTDFDSLWGAVKRAETPQQFWKAMDAIRTWMSPGFSPNEAREVQLGWVNEGWSAASCPAQHQWPQMVAERLGDIFRARERDAMGVLRALPVPPVSPEEKKATDDILKKAIERAVQDDQRRVAAQAALPKAVAVYLRSLEEGRRDGFSIAKLLDEKEPQFRDKLIDAVLATGWHWRSDVPLVQRLRDSISWLDVLETRQSFWKEMDAMWLFLCPGTTEADTARERMLSVLYPEAKIEDMGNQEQYLQFVASKLEGIKAKRDADLQASPASKEMDAEFKGMIEEEEEEEERNRAGRTPPPLDLNAPPKTPEHKAASPPQLPPAPIKVGKAILAHTGETTTEEDEPEVTASGGLPPSPTISQEDEDVMNGFGRPYRGYDRYDRPGRRPFSPRRARSRSRSRSRERREAAAASPILVRPEPRRDALRAAIHEFLHRERNGLPAAPISIPPSELIMPRSSMTAVRNAAASSLQQQQPLSMIDLTDD